MARSLAVGDFVFLVNKIAVRFGILQEGMRFVMSHRFSVFNLQDPHPTFPYPPLYVCVRVCVYMSLCIYVFILNRLVLCNPLSNV